MIQLSVAVITYNEERNIRRCLESVAPVADEIVVVDSGSTDKTREICEEMGARVVVRDFEGHIQQKNFALDQCAYDHVLSLDADEALSETLQESIVQTKANWVSEGYCFNRLTRYVNQWVYHCGWYPDRKLRLVKKSKARWGGVNPHDILKLNSEEVESFLKGDLLHYSYDSISSHIRQTNSFTTIAAREAFQAGKRTNLPQIIIRPLLKFLRDYILKRGFCDGRYGLIICLINSLSVFLKYTKINEMQKGRTV